MSRHAGIYEMRAKLGELVRAASAGETIIVDVRGCPAAKLVPYREGAENTVAWFKSRASGEPWGVTAAMVIRNGERIAQCTPAWSHDRT